MESLQHYLISLTAVSLLIALCQAAMPSGTVKRVSCFTCSLLLFVVVVRPVLRTDFNLLFSRWESAYAALAVHDERLESTNYSVTEQLIARETGAYIESKADSDGISCEVTIHCREENGLPLPDRADVSGTLDSGAQSILTALIQKELGIPSERIQFTQEKGGSP
ncbi:MAG: hypothetical protein MJ077_04285 [Oscillospiraceae bacterium]|nr:hypothetical protein [Oscillospiraceae bacterium]